MSKKALVVGTGGLRGAYSAGAVATLCRELGPDYFDAVYASSVGVFASTFFISNQPDTIENTWRNLVHGRKLVNLLNALRGKPVLDLDYLVKIFQSDESLLNLDDVFRNPTRLVYAVTDYGSGKAVYKCPTRDNIWNLMKASCALPFFHGPVIVDGLTYIDGGLTDPLPIDKARADGYDNIIAVWNKPRSFYVEPRMRVAANTLALMSSAPIRDLLKDFKNKMLAADSQLDSDRLRVIRPSQNLPLNSLLDTNKDRLNTVISMGVSDAQDFLRNLGN